MGLDRAVTSRGAGCIAVLLLVVVASAASQTSPLTIKSGSLPTGLTGTAYKFSFVAQGGRMPYAWRLSEGTLPPGLQLDPKSGAITGVPKSTGGFRFTVVLGDASPARNQVQREYTLVIAASLTIQWLEPPQLNGQSIQGRVVVSNQTGNPFDQTVIILAVNEIGKAFALGYQHFTLKPQTTSPPILFDSALPFGNYIVDADAVAEVPATNTIYRARLRTSNPMVIRQP
jgi:hypothetical protein